MITIGEARSACREWRLQSEDQRHKDVLINALKHTPNADDAVLVTALGRIETHYDVVFPADLTKDPPDWPECPCCTTLAFERTDGIKWSQWNDPTTRKILEHFDLVGGPGDGTYAMKWKKPPNQTLNDPISHAIFREALLTRAVPMIAQYSIGLNQIYLKYGQGELSSGTPAPGVPASWEELYNFYTLGGIEPGNGRLFELIWHTWSFAIANNGVKATMNSDDATLENWLQKQTGNASLAKLYYNGAGPWANTNGGFKASLAKTKAIYATIPT